MPLDIGRSVSVSHLSDEKRPISNLLLRVITASVGIPLVLAVDYLGGPLFAAVIGVASAAGALEMYRMEAKLDYRPFALAGVLASAIVAGLPVAASRHAQDDWIGVLALFVAGIGGIYLLRPLYPRAFLNWVLTLVPVLYVGIMLGHLSLLREVRQGPWWVLATLVITWAYDTGAYFAGSKVGKRPFMRHVSPNKTVEGVVGGLVLAALAAFIAIPTVHISAWQAPLLGLALGIAAQAGDLLESMIKRQTGVKDSGSLIPGHGGVLDRIDSLLVTGAVAYYAAALLGYAS